MVSRLLNIKSYYSWHCDSFFDVVLETYLSLFMRSGLCTNRVWINTSISAVPAQHLAECVLERSVSQCFRKHGLVAGARLFTVSQHGQFFGTVKTAIRAHRRSSLEGNDAKDSISNCIVILVCRIHQRCPKPLWRRPLWRSWFLWHPRFCFLVFVGELASVPSHPFRFVGLPFLPPTRFRLCVFAEKTCYRGLESLGGDTNRLDSIWRFARNRCQKRKYKKNVVGIFGNLWF